MTKAPTPVQRRSRTAAREGKPAPVSRKQREIAARGDTILDIAQEILVSEGYLGLTMARIAERLEYSKGTVYQHFGCKEEVILCLVLRNLETLLERSRACLQADEPRRGRVLMAIEAYCLHVREQPVLMENLSTLKSSSILEKVPAEQQNKLRAMETELMTVLSAEVAAAAQAGEFAMPRGLSAQELTFGLWGMLHGALLIELASPDLSHMGLGILPQMAKKNIDVYLDGLHWHPLSHERNADDWSRRAHVLLGSGEPSGTQQNTDKPRRLRGVAKGSKQQ